MDLSGYQKLDIRKFNGLFDKGEPDSVPLDHFIDCLNIKFLADGVRTREGTSLHHLFTSGGARLSLFPFKDLSTGTEYIFSNDAEKIYKDDVAVTGIIDGMQSIAALQMLGKLFVSPHDFSEGKEKLYLYDGATGGFRLAGGDTPTAVSVMTAADGAAGKVNIGIHKLAVLFETNTGFLTPPGPKVNGVFTPTSYNAPGSKKVVVSNIPTGPAHVARKHIIATKAGGSEYYFTPTPSVVVGPLSAGAGEGWTNSNNVITSNDVYATISVPPNTCPAALDATNFGFAIPAGVTILGIKAEIEKKQGTGGVLIDNTITLLKGGISQGPADERYYWPSVDTYHGYGGPTALWKTTWTAEDINDPAFGVRLTVWQEGGTGYVGAYVDHIRVTVWYDDPLATELTLDFADTELIESADYLFDILEHPPAGTALTEYNGRLVIVGFPNPDGSLARVSLAGEPETFSSDGVVIVRRDDGFPLRTAAVLRNILYFFKTKGIFGAVDNGEEPANWDPQPIDDSFGSYVAGISRVSALIPGGTISGGLLVAGEQGFYFFNGSVIQPLLDWKISSHWKAVVGSTAGVYVDVTNKRIFITPLVGGGMLVGNFDYGLDSKGMRWTPWSFPAAIKCAGFLSDLLIFSTSSGDDYLTLKLDSTQKRDYGDVAIDSYIKTAYLNPLEGAVSVFPAVKLKISGEGILETSLWGLDDVDYAVLSPDTLSPTPGREIFKHAGFESEQASLKLECSELDSWFQLSRITLFGAPRWQTRPQ